MDYEAGKKICIRYRTWIYMGSRLNTQKNIYKHKMNRQQFNYLKISLNKGFYPSINQEAFLCDPLMFLVDRSICCDGIKN